MTESPEIAEAFSRAGIDPVCWTVAVRRMMLQLSKGNIRTAHRVLEDFVANEQIRVPLVKVNSQAALRSVPKAAMSKAPTSVWKSSTER